MNQQKCGVKTANTGGRSSNALIACEYDFSRQEKQEAYFAQLSAHFETGIPMRRNRKTSGGVSLIISNREGGHSCHFCVLANAGTCSKFCRQL
ncbi:hypothetical protein D1164_15235 [Mariniphaga sediminis]|uniref:Uncharacterized protein n=1 Tax=Mariniphaga sediminis TaxID=1628158 RepID=A0A399CYN2_9BACT|nr:hypothetical protein D1164_15235 [Mariniphaga sediminis]